MPANGYDYLQALLEQGLGLRPMYKKSFTDRMVVQKLAFLLKASGADLPWTFGWYIRGPYSTDLARDAFHSQEEGQPLPEVRNVDRAICHQLKEVLKDRINDVNILELISSLVYLRKNMYAALPMENIRERLIQDLSLGYKSFHGTEVEKYIDSVMQEIPQILDPA